MATAEHPGNGKTPTTRCAVHEDRLDSIEDRLDGIESSVHRLVDVIGSPPDLIKGTPGTGIAGHMHAALSGEAKRKTWIRMAGVMIPVLVAIASIIGNVYQAERSAREAPAWEVRR